MSYFYGDEKLRDGYVPDFGEEDSGDEKEEKGFGSGYGEAPEDGYDTSDEKDYGSGADGKEDGGGIDGKEDCKDFGKYENKKDGYKPYPWPCRPCCPPPFPPCPPCPPCPPPKPRSWETQCEPCWCDVYKNPGWPCKKTCSPGRNFWYCSPRWFCWQDKYNKFIKDGGKKDGWLRDKKDIWFD